MVIMASFQEGKWTDTGRSQEYIYWKNVEVPDAPKVSMKRMGSYGKA